MGLTASNSGGGDFELTPEGQYIARCYRIIDMGTQTSTGMYGTKEQHKVMVSWELLDEPYIADGRPYTVSQFYTVSLHEKAKLRADLEAWRGKKFTTAELDGFDLGNVLGVYCMIQVVHSDDGKYANVQSIMAYKGDKPKPVNDNVVFDIDDPDMDVFRSLSEGMQGKIMQSPEWQAKQKPLVHAPVAKPVAAGEKQDVVIEDIGDEPISLDDIPF